TAELKGNQKGLFYTYKVKIGDKWTEAVDPYVRAASVKDGIIVQVKDEGCGIPKDKIPKLNEAFYTTKETGTGLGLVVTEKIIKDHNGKMRFLLYTNSEIK
ncbi:ATP-binding protein, partial [Bacillus sp. SS-TM]